MGPSSSVFAAPLLECLLIACQATRHMTRGGRKLRPPLSTGFAPLAFVNAPRYTARRHPILGVAMSATVAEIEATIRALSREDKTELIRGLIAELDGPGDAGVERAWLEEAQRRRQEVVDGTVQPIPGDRVFANLGARLKR